MGVEIRTERLLLRPLEMADAPRISALCGDLAVARWLARVPHPYPKGEAERFVVTCLEDDASVWAVECRGEPGLIGVVGIEGDPESETLGYWLGVPYWGQGYASEATAAAIGWAFGEAGLERLRSGVFEGNDASLRVQEKLGFRVTGRRMLPCLSLCSQRPHIDTALTRAAWEARA